MEDEGPQATGGPARAAQTEWRMPFGEFVLLKGGGREGDTREGGNISQC